MARDIRNDEKETADLLVDFLRSRRGLLALLAGNRRFELGDFLLDLGKYGCKRRPIEADGRRARLQRYSAHERGEGHRHIVEQGPRLVFGATCRLATIGFLLSLDALPGAARQKRIPEARILEHMRVPTDHLSGDGIDHVAEAEASLFFGP